MVEKRREQEPAETAPAKVLGHAQIHDVHLRHLEAGHGEGDGAPF